MNQATEQQQVREIVVYIHGITPSPVVEDHTQTYRALHEGIAAHLPSDSPWHAAQTCFIEWGWDRGQQPDAAGHQQLARAQQELAARMLAARRRVHDWSLNPFTWLQRLALRMLRPTLLYGFPDVAYYVSRDGKNSVRQAVAAQMLQQIGPLNDHNGQPLISLTLVGHSAGSLVTFDLSFYLFYRVQHHQFLEAGSHAQLVSDLRRLRALAAGGRLRIRRMFTLGSPISLVPYRSNAVVRILAQGGRLDPRWHGLLDNPPAFGQPLAGPRWLNIWDRDDPIAWPVEPLIQDGEDVLKDVAVDVADSATRAHSMYWHAPDVHRILAEAW